MITEKCKLSLDTDPPVGGQHDKYNIMKLIVGLGNPGTKYAKTRHNAGFMFIDFVNKQATNYPPTASQLGRTRPDYEVIGGQNSNFQTKKTYEICKLKAGEEDLILVKPLTFMNESGKAVVEVLKNSPQTVADLVVVHDDLDLRLGEFKIQKGKGPKVHNGVNDIEQKLGTKEFTRVRVGVDNRAKENRLPGEAYVLQAFTEGEMKVLSETFEKIYKSVVN